MKNPCDTCIIKTMCGELCKSREDYYEYWQKKLDSICKNHFYTKSGKRISDKFIKTEILQMKEKIIKRIDKHRSETLDIMFRRFGRFNGQYTNSQK